jgi:hypothetical protein
MDSRVVLWLFSLGPYFLRDFRLKLPQTVAINVAKHFDCRYDLYYPYLSMFGSELYFGTDIFRAKPPARLWAGRRGVAGLFPLAKLSWVISAVAAENPRRRAQGAGSTVR